MTFCQDPNAQKIIEYTKSKAPILSKTNDYDISFSWHCL